MGFHRGPKIVTDGLICLLDAANIKSYPGSGTSILDLTGNGNNGTISNGEFVSDSNCGYLRNAGNVSSQFKINLSHTDTLNNTFTTITGGWTIEELIWTNSTTYPESDAAGVASVAGYGIGATGFDWDHAQSTSNFLFGQTVNGVSSTNYDDSINISISSPYNKENAWRHRTMIWDRGNDENSLYINGDFINNGSTPNTSGKAIYDGGGIQFGCNYGWYHFGRRSFIRIYNRVLSADEVKQNYECTKGRFDNIFV